MLNKDLIMQSIKKVIPYLKIGLATIFWLLIPFFYFVFFTDVETSEALLINAILFLLFVFTPVLNGIYGVLLILIVLLVTTEKERKENPYLSILQEPSSEDDANK